MFLFNTTPQVESILQAENLTSIPTISRDVYEATSEKRISLPAPLFKKVRESCEVINQLVERSPNEILGHTDGFALIWILMNFENWTESVKKMRGWGKTPTDWRELEHSYEKNYLPLGCETMISRGICSKKKPCSSKGGVIEGVKLKPNPLLYAKPSPIDELSIRSINISSSIPTDEVLDSILSRLQEIDSLYLYNDQVTDIREHEFIIATEKNDFQATLTNYFNFYTETVNKQGEVSINYKFLSDHHLRILLKRARKAKLKEVRAYSRFPLIIKSENGFSLSKHGYNLDSKIYVSGGKYENFVKKDILEKVFSEFRFRSDIDRINILGILLTSFVHHFLPGAVPSLAIEGNQKGLGKTILGMIVGLILQGNDPQTMNLTDDEAELDKRICTNLKFGNFVVLFDNVKKSPDLKILGGAFLERIITSVKLQFRLLGGNEMLELKNNLFVIVTTNGIESSDDYISRRVLVELYGEGESTKLEFNNSDIVEFVRENLEQVRFELFLLVKNWIDKGAPLAKIEHRFRNWAPIVGGILEVNGLNGFLSNQNQYHGASASVRTFEKCLRLLPKNIPITAKIIFERCTKGSDYFKDYDNVPGFSKKVLSPLLGQELRQDEEIFLLVSCGKQNDKTALYILRNVNCDQEMPENKNILLLTKKVNEINDLFSDQEEASYIQKK